MNIALNTLVDRSVRRTYEQSKLVVAYHMRDGKGTFPTIRRYLEAIDLSIQSNNINKIVYVMRQKEMTVGR